MTREIWNGVREFYRPILACLLAGFGLLIASIPARYVHPLLVDAFGYGGVGCIGIMLILYLRQVWRIQVARDGLKTTMVVWAITLLMMAAFEYWRLR